MAAHTAKYQIIDEPGEGPLSRFALPPVLPFFLWMFFREIGTAVFIFNALALRGRRMWLEIALAGLSYGVYWLMIWFYIQVLVPAGVSTPGLFKYYVVLPIAIGIWLAYRVFVSQNESFEIRNLYREAAGFRPGSGSGSRMGGRL